MGHRTDLGDVLSDFADTRLIDALEDTERLAEAAELQRRHGIDWLISCTSVDVQGFDDWVREYVDEEFDVSGDSELAEFIDYDAYGDRLRDSMFEVEWDNTTYLVLPD